MKQGARTAAYDGELRIEAYRFDGIMQPFPSRADGEVLDLRWKGFQQVSAIFPNCQENDSANFGEMGKRHRLFTENS